MLWARAICMYRYHHMTTAHAVAPFVCGMGMEQRGHRAAGKGRRHQSTRAPEHSGCLSLLLHIQGARLIYHH